MKPEPLQDGVHRVAQDEADRLVEVWEASVRATHHFLSESDIQFFKPLVQKGLPEVEELYCARDMEGAIVAFLAVVDGKMEALFVHPEWHRAGLGRRLATYAVEDLGATKVDVNEQNEQAIAFYRHLGYEVVGRSELDSTGKPFPLLHMRMPAQR